MRQQPVIITLGIVQVIILTLFGMYFYRLTHKPSLDNSPMTQETKSGQGEVSP